MPIGIFYRPLKKRKEKTGIRKEKREKRRKER
jgi:hypothetical protein